MRPSSYSPRSCRGSSASLESLPIPPGPVSVISLDPDEKTRPRISSSSSAFRLKESPAQVGSSAPRRPIEIGSLFLYLKTQTFKDVFRPCEVLQSVFSEVNQ